MYRWVNDGDEYICTTEGDKYQQQKKQQSTDSGSTWTDVDPKETRKGSLLEECSEDCGCTPPADCPVSGSVIMQMVTILDGSAKEYDSALAFNTGNTVFTGSPTFSCDGTVITSAELGDEGGGALPTGYRYVKFSTSENTGPERNGPIIISAPKGDGTCAYNLSYTQQTKDADFKISIEFDGAGAGEGRSPYFSIVRDCDVTGTPVYRTDRWREPFVSPASWSNSGGTAVAMVFTQNDENALTVTVWWDDDREHALINDITLNPSDPSEQRPQFIMFGPAPCGTMTFNTDDYSDGRHTLHVLFDMGHYAP